MGERCRPFRQFSDVRLGIIRVGFAVSGHNLAPGRVRVLVVHIVRKIVEMEEPVHEVTTHPQFVEGCRWVARTGEL